MAEKTDRTPFQIAVPRLSNVEAYVDSSAFIAFFDKSDTWHARFAGLFARAKGLATTTLVIAETHGWFLRRFDSYRAEIDHQVEVGFNPPLPDEKRAIPLFAGG